MRDKSSHFGSGLATDVKNDTKNIEDLRSMVVRPISQEIGKDPQATEIKPVTNENTEIINNNDNIKFPKSTIILNNNNKNNNNDNNNQQS